MRSRSASWCLFRGCQNKTTWFPEFLPSEVPTEEPGFFGLARIPFNPKCGRIRHEVVKNLPHPGDEEPAYFQRSSVRNPARMWAKSGRVGKESSNVAAAPGTEEFAPTRPMRFFLSFSSFGCISLWFLRPIPIPLRGLLRAHRLERGKVTDPPKLVWAAEAAS
jgi:hypothetical protein